MGRELPYVSADRRVVVPGVGTFVLDPVGNTTYSTGVFVYCQPEGEPSAMTGIMGFRVVIDPSLDVVWEYCGSANSRHPALPADNPYLVAACRIMDTFALKDPIAFMFQVLSAAEMEIESCNRTLGGESARLNFLQEVAAGRMKHSMQVEEAKVKLEVLVERLAGIKTAQEPRLTPLKHLVAEIRIWCSKKQNSRNETILEVIERCLTVPEPAAAPSP